MYGERLRKVREESGHSQESLAEMVGIGNRQIWRYENGKTEPDGEVLAKIAQALNVSADYLLGLSDDPTPANLLSGQLNAKERAVIAALRRDSPLEAIKVIVGN